MAKEWIEVVDTAVKIGLGALISGTFTYIGLVFKDNSEKSKLIHSKNVELLQEAIGEFIISIGALKDLGSTLSGAAIVANFDQTDDGKQKYTDARYERIRQYDKNLQKSWENRRRAKTIFVLLQMDDVKTQLGKLNKLENTLRDNLFVKRKVYSDIKELDEISSEVNRIEASIMKSASDYFNNL